MIWSEELERLPWARESEDGSVARWVEVYDRMVGAGLDRDDAARAADLETAWTR